MLAKSRGHPAPAAGGAASPMRVVIVGEALAMRVEHFQLSALQIVATTPKAEGALMH